MRKSPYPLEQDLGIRWYRSDAGGIGGKLRSEPEDFVVEEIPLPDTGGAGPYLICRITKKNWEHQHAIREIARRLGISHRRIGWAGTKDRRAITTQYISLYNVHPDAISQVRLRDILIEPIRQQNTQLSLGDLLGNRFSIRIHSCTAPDLAGAVADISTDIAAGIPNYYGLQRFGGIRPVTHRVGERILAGDYEGAVNTYIGSAYPQEPEHVRNVRRIYLETRNPLAALEALPVAMGYERAMLQHLHNRPGDYAGALHALPPKLLSMFVSAFQSYLFNEGLSERIASGQTLDEPLPGDRLLFGNRKEDVVHTTSIMTATRLIRRGTCSIALSMPGRERYCPASHAEMTMEAIMAERGITAESFRKASEFVRTAFKGALRPIALKTEVNGTAERDCARLAFTLPPGHYATTVAREYMKADPYQMI